MTMIVWTLILIQIEAEKLAEECYFEYLHFNPLYRFGKMYRD